MQKIEIVGGVEDQTKEAESCLMIKKKAKTESKRGQKRRGRFLFLGLIRPTINFG